MFGNPVRGPRIVPFGVQRTALDKLPNGRPAFRVTLRFSDPNAYPPYDRHEAMDIANYNCGDELLAMASGVVIPLADSNGALGQEVQHDNGWRTRLWHMDRRVDLIGVRVPRGRVIGYVGDTGLVKYGCHAHVEVLDPQGNPRDPWPLLDQNATAPLPPPNPNLVIWHAIMYSIGVPFIRSSPGGPIIGKAKVGQQFESLSITKNGPTYVDPRNGNIRRDWVNLTGRRCIAKAFLKTRKKL